MYTYWGQSQQVTEYIGKDLMSVATASHGGFGVIEKLALKHGLDKHTTTYGGYDEGYYWFEEDEDWVIPFTVVPAWVPLLRLDYPKKSMEELFRLVFQARNTHSRPRYHVSRALKCVTCDATTVFEQYQALGWEYWHPAGGVRCPNCLQDESDPRD